LVRRGLLATPVTKAIHPLSKEHKFSFLHKLL